MTAPSAWSTTVILRVSPHCAQRLFGIRRSFLFFTSTPKKDSEMSRETSLVKTVADQVALPPEKVLHVFEHSFRELHRRMYEYDGMNGDYICEELVHELSETAWIHLYLFLVLYQIKYSSDHPEDVMLGSTIQLQYLGESDRWQPYLDETKEWKMSGHLRNLWSHDVEP